jgi:hypothetical protein
MADKSFEEYKGKLLDHNRETLNFLSNHHKSERERCVSAAFLRCLGIDFSVADLLSVPDRQDPPDVKFRRAQFEVCDILDSGRKPHREAKERVHLFEQAKTIDDVLLPKKRRVLLSYSHIFDLITKQLSKKAKKYGMNLCANLDALVHIRRHASLNCGSFLPCYEGLIRQGWRSVSFVMPPNSHVIYAEDGAPSFIKSYAGQTIQNWPDPDTYYAL